MNSAAARVRAGLVALGAILVVVLAPLAGIVRAFDSSPLDPGLVAGLPGLLPAALALGWSCWRPNAGAWATALAGGFGLVRLGGDLDVITGPDAVVRPELFHETTLRAHPFALGPGSALLLVGDLLMVAGAVLAGRVIGNRVVGPIEVDVLIRPRPRWPVLVAGGLGAALAVAGALIPPYQGGYLLNRLLPPGTGAGSLVAVVLLAVLTGTAVVLAARVPADAAVALLAAVALAVAAPALTELSVTASGVELSRTASWAFTLAGAVALAAAAFGPARPARPAGPASSPESAGTPGPGPAGRSVRARPTALAPVAVALALAAAFAGVLAATRSGLRVDGHPDTAAESGLRTGFSYSASIGLPFVLAAGFTLVAAVLTGVRPTTGAGRVLLGMAVAASGYAVTQGLVVYQQVASLVPGTASTALFTVHRWTLGPGLWWGIAGLGLTVLAAIVAVLARRREREVDDTDAALRRWRTGADEVDESGPSTPPYRLVLGVALAVLIVVAGFLPVYSTGDGPGPAVSFYAVGSLGVWLLTLAALAGMGVAALGAPGSGLAGAAGAAALVAGRLPVPAAVAAMPGYQPGSGRVVVAATAALVLVGGALLAVRRRGRTDRRVARSGGTGDTVAPSGTERDRSRAAGRPGRSARSGRQARPPASQRGRSRTAGSAGRKLR